MIKEERPVFLKVFSIVIIVLVIEAGAIYFAYTQKYPIPEKLVIIQIPLALFVLITAYIKNRRIWNRKVEEHGIDVSKYEVGSKTDLDALYKIIQDRKTLSVKSVSNLFKIKEDLAMEWARILEGGELVRIDYPGFGSPRINLKVNKKKDGKPKHGEKTTENKNEEKKTEEKTKKILKTTKEIQRKPIPVKPVIKKTPIKPSQNQVKKPQTSRIEKKKISRKKPIVIPKPSKKSIPKKNPFIKPKPKNKNQEVMVIK